MNKKSLRHLTVFALFLIAGTVSAQRVLKYTDHEPLGGMRTKYIKEVLFAAIEKESNGRLRIEDHWNSELSTSYDALHNIAQEGVADMGIVVPEYSAKNLPLHQIFKSFPTGPTDDNQIAFFKRVYEEVPEFSQELENENVVNLFFATGFPVAFFSTKSLDTLGDIKGEKWRSASFWHQYFLKNVGATPISMPWGEGIYTAMKEGSLDGLMVNIDGGYQLKVHEIAPNILFSEDLWMGHVYLLVMNKNTWNELPQEDKSAIERAAETAYKTLGAVMKSSFDAQIKKLEADGAKVRILSSDELEQWKTDTQYPEVQAAWVEEQQSKGVKNVAFVMEKVNAIWNDTLASE